MLFRDASCAHVAVSFGSAYLATPNVGVLGLRGAVAVPLLATLLAWGRQGVAKRIESCSACSPGRSTAELEVDLERRRHAAVDIARQHLGALDRA